MNKLVIIGAGQQGKVCNRLAVENGIEVFAFVDDFKRETYEGVPIYERIECIERYWEYLYIVAFGSIEPRRRYCNEIARLGLKTTNLIDRTAVIEDGASIGSGNFIGKFAVIYASAVIGDNNIINCKAICATDSKIGDNNNISLGCNICGGVTIEDDCYVGCQASVVSGVIVKSGSTIAAGAVVLHDVPKGEFVAGVPAVKKERKANECIGNCAPPR